MPAQAGVVTRGAHRFRASRGHARWSDTAHDPRSEPRRELSAGMEEQLSIGPCVRWARDVRPAAVPHRPRAARRVAARRRHRRCAVRHLHHQPPRRPLRPAGDPCARLRARHVSPRPRHRDLRLDRGGRLRRRATARMGRPKRATRTSENASAVAAGRDRRAASIRAGRFARSIADRRHPHRPGPTAHPSAPPRRRRAVRHLRILVAEFAQFTSTLARAIDDALAGVRSFALRRWRG